MLSSAAWNFLFLSLHRHRTRHVAVMLMAVVIVTLLCSVMFLASAIRRDVSHTLNQQADIIVQKVRGGKAVDLPVDWAQDFGTIAGVNSAVPRVFGRYFHTQNAQYFTVVGIDPFDNQASENLQTLMDGLDLKKFLAGNNMIVGRGVQEFLENHHYNGKYDFISPDQQRLELTVFDTFPTDSYLFTNDMVVMDIDLARQVLGIAEDQATDIVLHVPNELEGDSIMVKLIQQHFDIRVIQKKEIATAFDNLFNYKGGVFLLLYLIVLSTFVLILYQRHSMITGPDRRQIGILRAVGWGIGDVISLKVWENAVVAGTAFVVGILLSYFYVFFLGAPGLIAVFLGNGNLPVNFTLSRGIDFGLISLLFLFYMVPFIASVLIPVWRVAITEPVEAMK
ncbi:MAG: FtsX-like permease family protein [bacterium]|nr:FtsX-like permease family protein [bacterium]